MWAMVNITDSALLNRDYSKGPSKVLLQDSALYNRHYQNHGYIILYKRHYMGGCQNHGPFWVRSILGDVL